MGQRATISVLLLVLGAVPAPAADPYPAGEVVERVTCSDDEEMAYALYLPSDYSPEQEWPVLFVMDPRGRARMALDLFRPSAETYGYVLASSYNTLSDGPREPNERAMRAMLPDIQKRLSIDPRRIYMAGFSGTARVAWDFGYRIRGIAGIIGIGGALPYGLTVREAPFVFFGAAGTTDFNYEEMRALDLKLDGTGIVHRMEYFEGPHSWCPEPICTAGVEWLEIQAMYRKLKPVDTVWLTGAAAARMRQAEKQEKEGNLYGALVSYTAIVEDFPGLPLAASAAEKKRELEESKSVMKTAEKMKKLAAQQADFEERLYNIIADYRKQTPPSHGRSLVQLQIRSLQKRAKGKDPLDADAAQRLLELAFVNTSFYEPRDYISEGDYDRALGMLEIAGAIKPDDPRVCYGEARVRAQTGKIGEALDALRCAVDSGLVPASLLEGDDLLAPLRVEPGYREILESLSGK